MSVQFHPCSETLMATASGQLDAGSALVVATHLALCPACRRVHAGFEAAAGVLLEEMPLGALPDDLFARTLALIDAPEQSLPRRARQPVHRPDVGCPLPGPLAAHDIGKWRWLGPGIHIASVSVPHAVTSKVLLLKIAPGRVMPQHGHNGIERTVVLKGAFSDAHGVYRSGDLAEEDGDHEHQPRVDGSGECICLASLEGPMRLHGIAGLLQPLFGL